MNHATRMSLTLCLATIGAMPLQAAEPGIYVTAGVGAAEEDPGASIGTNFSVGFPPAGIVHLEPDSVEVEGGDLAWSIGVGYQFNRYLAAEFEYLDFGSTDVAEVYSLDPTQFPFVGSLTKRYSSKTTGPAVSILGKLPVGESFAFYLRAGVFWADRNLDMPLALGLEESAYGDTVWLGGVGVDWSFAGRWGVRAEYQLSGETGDTIIAAGSSVEALSLRLRFGF